MADNGEMLELRQLGASKAAEAALRGEGLSLESELLTRRATASLKRRPDRTKLAHLDFALGMVNWYMERPGEAAKWFGAAAENYQEPADRLRSRANQLLSMCQARETLGKQEEAYLNLPVNSLDEKYSHALLLMAFDKNEEAVSAFTKIIESPKEPKQEARADEQKPRAGDEAVVAGPGRPVPPSVGDKAGVDVARLAAEALVSLLVAESRKDEAKDIWQKYLTSFPA